MKIQEGDERVNDERHQKHCADQQQEQLSIFCEDRKTVFGNIRENDTHNSERCEVNDPADDERDRIGSVCHEKLGAVGCDALHSKTEHACPEKNADVVAVDQGAERIVHQIGKKRMENFTETLRDHCRIRCIRESDPDRKGKTR